MLLVKYFILASLSNLIKLGTGLFIIKILSISFGPSGLGYAGNFKQLVNIINLISGAGIFNGITKYVAQYKDDKIKLRATIGTSSTIILSFSLILVIIFILVADLISQGVFGNTNYQGIIRLLAFIQIFVACANLLLALMNGFSNSSGIIISLILGNIIGVIIYYICYYFGGYKGALLGLALLPTSTIFPAIFILKYERVIPFFYLYPRWDNFFALQLGKFAIMTLVTSIVFPITCLIIQNLLLSYYNWVEVGIWYGINILSNAFIQFVSTFFSIYLLPNLSKLIDKQKIANEIIISLCFVLFIAFIISIIFWLLRDIIIWFLFSTKFRNMRYLFIWQVVGNILKIGSYTFGYLIIAKALFKLYIFAEFIQVSLLVTLSYWLIPINGAIGATQAYMITYIIYFIICCNIFLIWYKYK